MAFGTFLVSGTARVIVAQNTRRKSLSLVNMSEAAIVYLGSGTSVTTSSGLPLYQTQTRDNAKSFGAYLGDVCGVTDGTHVDLRYWETT